ncbi:sensor histidine kinase [Rheinheimera salexigens]|uniref:histidine kinase n=2 Tax=Rheinheimera salexigens TaxID=1628148 RepID=A0A1E7Q5N0_9GAMM|nr:sensor histidine kinase [Rheinheimera salexigens]OEY69479.1 hypothetical protein BI198_07810 [Rheinheimera salexigens]
MWSFSSTNVQAEIFKRFGIDDGLPNATIYSVAQDQRGFLWLGSTNSGLLRFDGYRFHEFPVLSEAELSTKQTPDVGVIIIDTANNLWAGTWGFGLSKIDSETGQLQRFTTKNGLAGDKVQVLFQSADKAVWVGTTEGLSRISPDGSIYTINTVSVSSIKDSASSVEASSEAEVNNISRIALAHPRVWSLSQTADGTLWIGTSAGLQAWRSSTGLTEVYELVAGADTFSRNNEIRALLAIDNTIWIGSRNGLFIYENNSFIPVQLKHDTSPEPIINVLKKSGNNQILLGSYDGFYRVDSENRHYISSSGVTALDNVNIRSIIEDNSGVLWLGTRESGLYRSNNASAAFQTLADILPNLALAQKPFTVTSVLKTKDAIWLGGTESVYLIEPTSQSFQEFKLGSRINAFAQDADNSVFIATDNGLYQYKHQILHTIDAPFKIANAANRNVRDIVIDEQGTFYLGLWGQGVIEWQPEANTVRQWLTNLRQQDMGNTVQNLLVTADQQLWVATRYSGLFQIDLNSGVIQQHSTEPQQSTEQQHSIKLPHNEVHCIKEYQQTLAICTKQGIVLYDRKLHKQTLYNEKEGLIDANILGLLQQENQTIWALSASGLSFRDAQTNSFIHYNRNDGMLGTELNSNAVAADDNLLYIGSINGLIIVNPALLQSNRRAPKPVLAALTIDHENLQVMPFQQDWPVIELTQQQHTINFEFSALDFHDPARNQFHYKLQGVDQDWVVADKRNSAFYANLPPGEYALWLTASNNHGVFSAPEVSARLKVLPHWWQQSWVIYLAILLSILVLGLIHRYRLRHIRHINRLLQVAVDTKAKAQLVLETRVAERTHALEESSMTLSLRSKQLEKSLAALATKNEELKRLDKLKDEFVATVSHELRTPLTAIRGAVGLLAQNVIKADSPAYKNMLTTAQLNSERLAQLINDLLDLQKFAAGTFTLSRNIFDLAQLAQQAVHAMQPYADRYSVQLYLNDDNDAKLLVNADSLRIRQVMDNLISNAIKFSPEQGLVTVQLFVEQSYVKLQVEDQGSGIPEAFRAHIFQNFSQADGSDSRAKEGTGLGLAICKKIIINHQGQIGFNSEVGRGSQFWFKLALISE